MTTQRKGLVGYEDVNLWEGDVNDKRFDRENSQNQLISPYKFGSVPLNTDFYRFQNLIHFHKGPGGVFTDVRHYGAVGDGTTDDTAAIQRAMAAIGAGIVYFPVGTYLVSGLEITTAYQGFHGEYGSKLYLMDGSDTDVLTFSASHSGISRLGVDGNKAGQGGASNGIFIGSGITNIRVWDLDIINCYSDSIKGTAAATTDKISITRCQITDGNGSAINFTGGLDDVVVVENLIYNMGEDGIIMDDTQGATISNNVIEAITKDGIDLGGETGRTVVDGNIISIKGGAYNGIDLNNSNNCAVSNNTIYISGSDDTTGIYCAGGDYNVISGNVLQSTSDLAIGVDLTGCVGCVIEGNTIDGVINGTTKTAYGVKVTAGGTGGFPNIIKGNLINVNGASAAGILLFTETNTHVLEGCVIEGNIIQVEGNAATRGIELYCNHVGAFVDRNIIMGNSLRGNSASTQTAILFDENGTGGTMAGNIIMGNVIQDWPVGIQPDGDTQTRITNNQFYNNEDDFVDDVATPFDRFGEVDVHGTW